MDKTQCCGLVYSRKDSLLRHQQSQKHQKSMNQYEVLNNHQLKFSNKQLDGENGQTWRNQATTQNPVKTDNVAQASVHDEDANLLTHGLLVEQKQDNERLHDSEMGLKIQLLKDIPLATIQQFLQTTCSSQTNPLSQNPLSSQQHTIKPPIPQLINGTNFNSSNIPEDNNQFNMDTYKENGIMRTKIQMLELQLKEQELKYESRIKGIKQEHKQEIGGLKLKHKDKLVVIKEEGRQEVLSILKQIYESCKDRNTREALANLCKASSFESSSSQESCIDRNDQDLEMSEITNKVNPEHNEKNSNDDMPDYKFDCKRNSNINFDEAAGQCEQSKIPMKSIQKQQRTQKGAYAIQLTGNCVETKRTLGKRSIDASPRLQQRNEYYSNENEMKETNVVVVVCSYCNRDIAGPPVQISVVLGNIQVKGALVNHFKSCSYFGQYHHRLTQVAEAAAVHFATTQKHLIQSRLVAALEEKDQMTQCLKLSTQFNDNSIEFSQFLNDWKINRGYNYPFPSVEKDFSIDKDLQFLASLSRIVPKEAYHRYGIMRKN